MAGGKIDPKIAASVETTVRILTDRISAMERAVAYLASIEVENLSPGDARRDAMIRAISEIQQRNYGK